MTPYILGFIYIFTMLLGIGVCIYIYRDIKKHFISNESELSELRKRINL